MRSHAAIWDTNVPQKIYWVELKGQMCLFKIFRNLYNLNFVCNSMSCNNVKRVFLGFVKEKKARVRRKWIMDYLVLSPEWQSLIYCHFARACFSEILETLKRAKQRSDVIFPSIFLVLMENSQPLSCSVYKMLAEDCITSTCLFFFLGIWQN